MFSSSAAFTCSKLTTETLEQGVKYVEVNNKDTRTMPISLTVFDHFVGGVVLVSLIANLEHIPHLVPIFLLLTLNM